MRSSNSFGVFVISDTFRRNNLSSTLTLKPIIIEKLSESLINSLGC